MSYIYYFFWKYEPDQAIFQRNWSLAKGLSEKGLHVKVVFLMPNNSYCESLPVNIECIYLGNESKLKNKLLCLIDATIRASKMVKSCDSVISPLAFFPLSLIFRLFLPSGVNLYVEYSEYPPIIYGNKFSGYVSLKIFLHYIKKLSGLFVITNNLKKYFIQQHCNPDKVHVVNMTVDSNRFQGIQKQKSERYICYCGAVTSYKDGVDILLESFGRIASKIKDVKLYILGPVPHKEDESKFENIIQKYNIQDRIFMPGKIQGDKIPQYLMNAELLVLSRPNNIQAKYGFPTKLGEYLMTGNPVLITRVGELDNFLQDRKSCIFAKPNDVEDFTEKLEWAVLNPDQLKEIGCSGKKVALENFNYLIESEKIKTIIKPHNLEK